MLRIDLKESKSYIINLEELRFKYEKDENVKKIRNHII